MQRKRELTKMLSKKDLLKWIDETLQVIMLEMQINKSGIDGLGYGLIYCQLINHFDPHIIP
jgi:hypothetical protein